MKLFFYNFSFILLHFLILSHPNLLVHANNSEIVDVFINDTVPLNSIPESFLSVGLDSSIIRRQWCGMNFTRVGILARALNPAFLRLGGSEADFLLFKPYDPPFQPKPMIDNCDIGKYVLNKNFSLPGVEWSRFRQFLKFTGLEMIFDLNVLLRTFDDKWSMRNARTFLEYSHKRNYRMSFELGNEPSSFPHSVNRTLPAATLADDYRRVFRLLRKFPLYRHSSIVGPSVTNVVKKKSEKYLWKFLSAGGSKFINAVTFHQYYVNGREAKLENFTDPTILDSLKHPLRIAKRAAAPYKKPVWIGETASAWGGGAKGLSDTYASGFMWLDKLGLSSQFGISVVVRQAIYHGNYALIDKYNNPNPDFWLSLLFKRLIGTEVFAISSSFQTGLRLYAFSSKITGSDVIAVAINIGTSNITIRFPNSNGFSYLLEPTDGNLKSRTVLCNGELLTWSEDRTEAPIFAGLPFSTSFMLPAKRYAFFEL